MDRNHNGKLDANEVSTTKYVCNGADGKDGADGKTGADGKNSLIRSETEPVGVACPTGGAKYSSGLDTDGDGVLADSEVTNVQFICNGAAGKDGSNGLDTLVSLLTLDPENGSCPNGGEAVYSGRDRDADGLLDPDEVEQTAFVCNGANGVNALVRQAPEAPGENCEFGGTRLDSGLDSDADGVLADAEATQTSYVCHGAPGADGAAGQDGKSTLVAVTHEAPGSNCTTGGARVDTGLDQDGDGTLSAAEITSTSYVCDGPQGPAGESAAGEKLLQRLEFTPDACNTGDGVRIDSGLDANHNGKLDDAEVTGTAYVCNSELPWSHGAIAVGDAHSCASEADGSVRCWGTNTDGQLGDGTHVSRALPTKTVSGLGSAAFVAAGRRQSCAIVAGTAQCWGRDLLGDGTANSSPIPVTVIVTVAAKGAVPATTAPLDGVVALALGESHGCALRTDGTVWCWGSNAEGQLGSGVRAGSDGTRAVRAELPSIIGTRAVAGTAAGLSGVVAIAAGSAHNCALLSTGQVACWGTPLALGNNAKGASNVHVLASTAVGTKAVALTNVVAIDAGGDHSCAALNDGSVRCWGSNAFGELGTGNKISLHVASTAVPGITTARSLALGRDHSCAVLADASVQCWGSNRAGQLGNGSDVLESLAPVPVSLPNAVASIDSGPQGLSVCARMLDGHASCWGQQNGVPGAPHDSFPIAVPLIH